MESVKVKTADLLEKLKKNRGAHKGIYEKAMVEYRRLVIDELDKMLHEAKKGLPIKRKLSLPEPELHIDDYDCAIAMLEIACKRILKFLS